MDEWLPDSAFVVVVVRGVEDISRTTLPNETAAQRYIEKLRAQGLPREAIRLYRTRLARPSPRAL